MARRTPSRTIAMSRVLFIGGVVTGLADAVRIRRARAGGRAIAIHIACRGGTRRRRWWWWRRCRRRIATVVVRVALDMLPVADRAGAIGITHDRNANLRVDNAVARGVSRQAAGQAVCRRHGYGVGRLEAASEREQACEQHAMECHGVLSEARSPRASTWPRRLSRQPVGAHRSWHKLSGRSRFQILRHRCDEGVEVRGQRVAV